MRPADDFHAVNRLVAHEVEVFLGISKVLFERDRLRIIANEVQPTVAFQTGHLAHVGIWIVLEALCIAVFARLASQRAVLTEHPAVIETLERLGVTFAFAAHLGTPVGAGVEQSAHFALTVLVENDAPSPNNAGHEITRFLQLGLVAEVQPARRKNAFTLFCKHLGIGEIASGDFEEMTLVVDHHQWIITVRVHCALSSLALLVRQGWPV